MSYKTLLYLILLAVFASSISYMSAEEASKPNILFILADNWRFPSAGALDDPMAKAPTFDRIAREGVLFTHTFNPVPSCSPTRASWAT